MPVTSHTVSGMVLNPDGTYSHSVLEGLEVPRHDYIELSYTGSNLTGVVYKYGGTWDGGTDTYSGGDTVATLDLTYDGSNNLLKVAKV